MASESNSTVQIEELDERNSKRFRSIKPMVPKPSDQINFIKKNLTEDMLHDNENLVVVEGVKESLAALEGDNRRSRACDQCSKKKVKCGKQRPNCDRCVRFKTQCTWIKASEQSFRIGRPPKNNESNVDMPIFSTTDAMQQFTGLTTDHLDMNGVLLQEDQKYKILKCLENILTSKNQAFSVNPLNKNEVAKPRTLLNSRNGDSIKDDRRSAQHNAFVDSLLQYILEYYRDLDTEFFKSNKSLANKLNSTKKSSLEREDILDAEDDDIIEIDATLRDTAVQNLLDLDMFSQPSSPKCGMLITPTNKAPGLLTLRLSPSSLGHSVFLPRAKGDYIRFGGISPASNLLSRYPASLRLMSTLSDIQTLLSSGILPQALVTVLTPADQEEEAVVSSMTIKQNKQRLTNLALQLKLNNILDTEDSMYSTIKIHKNFKTLYPLSLNLSISGIGTNALPHSLVWQLIELYFHHFNLGYSLLNRQLFLDLLRGPRSSCADVQALVNAVLLSGSGHFPSPSLARKLARLFSSRAIRLTPLIYTNPTLISVQAFILLSRYPSTPQFYRSQSQTHVQEDILSHRAWYYHAHAMRMALGLGFHRPLPKHHSELGTNMGICQDQAEARMRTWWVLHTHDVLFRRNNGQTSLIDIDDVNVDLPNFCPHLDAASHGPGCKKAIKEATHSNPSSKFQPKPNYCHKAILIRINYFLVEDSLGTLQLKYRELLSYNFQPPDIPFSWGFDQSIFSSETYKKFLSLTRTLERRLSVWFEWAQGLGVQTQRSSTALKTSIMAIQKLNAIDDSFTIEIPPHNEYFSFLNLLHYLHLLVEMYRPHVPPCRSTHMLDNIRLTNLTQQPSQSPTLASILQLTAIEKCAFACRFGADAVLCREDDFDAIGIAAKWLWCLHFILGLLHILALTQPKSIAYIQPTASQFEDDKETDELSSIRKDWDRVLGLLNIIKSGSKRSALAYDTLSLLTKLIAADTSGLIQPFFHILSGDFQKSS